MLDGDNIIEGDDKLLEHGTTFYKDLFGNLIPISENLWEDGEKVDSSKNKTYVSNKLSMPFSKWSTIKLVDLIVYLLSFTKFGGILSRMISWN